MPVFSPDGNWIAFSANYDGNRDVYVMPAAGGEPQRLTWHPGQDVALGWTPDGKRVLFLSDRDAYADMTRMYTVPMEGGVAEVLPMWRAFERRLFSGRGEDCLRAKLPVATGMEAVPRRTDHADLHCAAEGSAAGESAA